MNISDKKTKFVIIILIAVLIIAVGLGLSYLFLLRKGEEEDGQTQTQEEDSTVKDLEQLYLSNYSFKADKEKEDIWNNFGGDPLQFANAVNHFINKLQALNIEIEDDKYDSVISGLQVIEMKGASCDWEPLIYEEKIQELDIENFLSRHIEPDSEPLARDDGSAGSYIDRKYFWKIKDVRVLNLGQSISATVEDKDWVNVTLSSRLCRFDETKYIDVSTLPIEQVKGRIEKGESNLFAVEFLPSFDVDYYTEEAIWDFENNKNIVIDNLGIDYFYLEEEQTTVPLLRLEGSLYTTDTSYPLTFWTWFIK